MSISTVVAFSELIRWEADSIISEWTSRVLTIDRARQVDRPTLIDHIPGLIQELCDALRSQEDMTIEPGNSSEPSEAHGSLRFQVGFDVVDVVAEYNMLREVLYDFAMQRDMSLDGRPAQLINRVLDRAIAFAVRAYAAEKTIESQRRREEHLSFVVHDLKTPLAAIETAMMIVESKHPDSLAPAKTLWEIMRRNARRLNALIAKLLEEQTNLQFLARRLEKRDFDVWPLVENLINDYRPLALAANTSVANEVPEDISVYADATALGRVFQNLLGNAIKYAGGGRVIIGGRTVDNKAEFWVEDSGSGIAPERLDKIFDKLESDGTAGGGLGLGLAIVKDLIDAHGGDVTVESTVGQGSKFTFRIPQLRE